MTAKLIVTFSKSGRLQTKVVGFDGITPEQALDAIDALEVDARTVILCRPGHHDVHLIRNGVAVHDCGSADSRMRDAYQPSCWRSKIFTWLPTAERAHYA